MASSLSDGSSAVSTTAVLSIADVFSLISEVSGFWQLDHKKITLNSARKVIHCLCDFCVCMLAKLDRRIRYPCFVILYMILYKKKLVTAAIVFVGLTFGVFADDIDDTSILDKESKDLVADQDFSLKTFASCEEMNEVVFDHLKASLKNQNYYPYHR